VSTPANTGPSVGAGGATGAPGSTPSHPASPGPPKATAKVWNETPQGVQLEGGYSAVREAFRTTLPSIRQQIDALAHRPKGG
jgi:hypothetical protein